MPQCAGVLFSGCPEVLAIEEAACPLSIALRTSKTACQDF